MPWDDFKPIKSITPWSTITVKFMLVVVVLLSTLQNQSQSLRRIVHNQCDFLRNNVGFSVIFRCLDVILQWQNMCRGTSVNFKWHWCWIIQNEQKKSFIFTTNTMDLKDFFLFEHVNLCIFRLASTRLQNGLLCHISYNSDLKLLMKLLTRSRVSNFISLDSCDRYIQVKVSLSERLFTNSVIHAARQKRTILRASSMQWRNYRAIHLTISHIWRKTGTQCSSNFSRTLPSLRASDEFSHWKVSYMSSHFLPITVHKEATRTSCAFLWMPAASW